MSPEIDSLYADDIICPWCGHHHKEPTEYSEGEMGCEECEKPFEIFRNIEVKYPTYKVSRVPAPR